MTFKVIEKFQPKGDQRKVISSISSGLKKKNKFQGIMGATGTGKTYVMAKIIENLQRPALILAHNKTLAAQLYKEFKNFFPNNAVEYFVSYYDYYQPEAYVAKRDLYIEKESSINDEIDRMRLKATAALVERKDVLIVASVSCIYGLGSPEDYEKMYLTLKIGQKISRRDLIRQLIDIQYNRKDDLMERGYFRVRGDIIDISPSYLKLAYRVEMFGDEIERISLIDPINHHVIEAKETVSVFPAKHFVLPYTRIEKACKKIQQELKERVAYFDQENKLLEKERIHSRTLYDLEMLRTVGYCPGIENYSRHLTGRSSGERPHTLIDYFPSDFLTFVDESHVSLPQLRGMYNGDRARKQSLVDYGFRLPSALDNRPLYFDEFIKICPQLVFVSATLNDYELEQSQNTANLVNRPTGLLDPPIEIRKTEGQIDDLFFEVKKEIEKKNRVLITTLTKKMAESLSSYLEEKRLKVTYIHSDIETIERVVILKKLRMGEIDVLIGINLLREGLDLPEVSLVAILDADKIGFLRSKTSLIQIVGRAARNLHGRVLMYADKVSEAMKACIEETENRRKIQTEFNLKHGITPQTIIKEIGDLLERSDDTPTPPSERTTQTKLEDSFKIKDKSKKNLKAIINQMDFEMKLAADEMDFERAIKLRDQIKQLKIETRL